MVSFRDGNIMRTWRIDNVELLCIVPRTAGGISFAFPGILFTFIFLRDVFVGYCGMFAKLSATYNNTLPLFQPDVFHYIFRDRHSG
jgi:hypothetical protein